MESDAFDGGVEQSLLHERFLTRSAHDLPLGTVTWNQLEFQRRPVDSPVPKNDGTWTSSQGHGPAFDRSLGSMIADDQDSAAASTQVELSVWTEFDRSASTTLIFPFAFGWSSMVGLVPR